MGLVTMSVNKERKTIMDNLYMELQSIENRGITIWLEGYVSDSREVASALSVCEESTYMRDYIFEEGELIELRFDKISN